MKFKEKNPEYRGSFGMHDFVKNIPCGLTIDI